MQTKTCTKCKETKPVSEFYKDKTKKGGFRPNCKRCTKEQVSLYREHNKEKAAACCRRWRSKNKELVREKNRRWYEENKEQLQRKLARYSQEMNNRSLELAHRNRQPWEDWESEFIVSENGLTDYQKAVKLGRSYYSIRTQRNRLKKSHQKEVSRVAN